MRLNMMPFSIFASHLGITDLVNKIKINTNLIKIILKCNHIWEYHMNKYIYNSSKKKRCEYACFPSL